MSVTRTRLPFSGARAEWLRTMGQTSHSGLTRSRRVWTRLAAAAGLAFWAVSASAQSGFEGKVTVSVETEKKSCRTCSGDPAEYNIDSTPLELLLRPVGRRDLSFGLQFDYEIDSEGGFVGSRRTNVENESSLEFWARKEFDDTFWGRLQTEVSSPDHLMSVGGRFGFNIDVSPEMELTGYLNLDRQFATGGGDPEDNGTFVEVRLEPEWDFDEYGFWIELRANKLDFDGSAADESRVSAEPGVWFDLGKTRHKGVVWLELERRTRPAANGYKRDTRLLGFGVEFDLGKRRDLFVGARVGAERESDTTGHAKRSSLAGLIFEFSKRF